MNISRLLMSILLLCTAGWTQAAEFTGKIIAVMDGDTLLVMQGSNPVKVRLHEIDAPEKAQPYGAASQQSLADMVLGKQVLVSSRAIDDYGRMVAQVEIAGLNVNHEQVRRGWAWEYSRFHGNRELVALQREAQQARRGLWAGAADETIEPSQWRKLHSPVISADAAPSVPATKALSSLPAVSKQACAKKHCSEMASCEEAVRSLRECGGKTLDGDGDGMPCENLCAPMKIKN